MKILVTGASGFVGERVLRAISEKGWSVVGTSRTGAGSLVAANITNLETADELRGNFPFDGVIHCAGVAHRLGTVADEEYERVNVRGTRNVAMLAAEAGTKHFIHLSSVRVYGKHGLKITENDKTNPKDSYSQSKLASEYQAAEIAARSGMALTIIRPAPVIGEGCKGNFHRLMRAVDRGWFINVGDGTAQKSIVYVGDVAKACTALIESKKTRDTEVFNLAGEPTTIRQLLELIYRFLGKTPRLREVPSRYLMGALKGMAVLSPRGKFRSAASVLETWLSDDVYSTDSIKETYLFEPAIPIDEAVRRTVSAYIAAR